MNPTETNLALATEASLRFLHEIQSRFNEKAIGLIGQNLPENERSNLSKAMEVVSFMHPKNDPETIRQFVRDMPNTKIPYCEVAESVAKSIQEIWYPGVVGKMLPSECLNAETQQALRSRGCQTLATACVPRMPPPA